MVVWVLLVGAHLRLKKVKALSRKTLEKKYAALFVVSGSTPFESELALMTDYSTTKTGMLNMWLEKRQLIPCKQAITWDDALSIGYALSFIMEGNVLNRLREIEKAITSRDSD